MAKKKQQAQGSFTKVKGAFLGFVALVTFAATQVDFSKQDFQLSDLANLVQDYQAYQMQKKVNYAQLNELPEYDGKNQVVTINQNIPQFTEEDLSLHRGTWQLFAPMDAYNRVGVANVMLHDKMRPRENRKDIASVKPTGWQQQKLADGKWLYNRSHLIGFQLTGENDNWKNLFTGTQQMNQKPMKAYEDQVARYIKESKNHVRYRVTPYFQESELVPRGIQMEAQSIEDNQLQFNIFIYNIQDGYQIDYATGKVKKSAQTR